MKKVYIIEQCNNSTGNSKACVVRACNDDTYTLDVITNTAYDYITQLFNDIKDKEIYFNVTEYIDNTVTCELTSNCMNDCETPYDVEFTKV